MEGRNLIRADGGPDGWAALAPPQRRREERPHRWAWQRGDWLPASGCLGFVLGLDVGSSLSLHPGRGKSTLCSKTPALGGFVAASYILPTPTRRPAPSLLTLPARNSALTHNRENVPVAGG